MDKIIVIFLAFLTVNFVNSSDLYCEDSATAQACELLLHSNRTKCDVDYPFRMTCVCTCARHIGDEAKITTENPDEITTKKPDEITTKSPDVVEESSDADPCQDSLLDQEFECQLRYRADQSICGLDNILQYCPCTCQGRTGPPEALESESIELRNPEADSVDSGIDDVRENNVNTALCIDVPDSKMEYDCQFRIASNPRLCNDASYRKMCRCTCSWFGNRATLQENVVQSLLTPDAVLPMIPDGSRTQDEGEQCPDAPWSPLSGICQIRAKKGECSNLNVREECPCTCAVPDVSNLEPVSTETPHPGGPSTGCIDTASERLCHYYLRNNMCESEYGLQYCRQSCNHCSEEPLAEGDAPRVNLMPDVDQPEDEPTPTPQPPCEDKAPSRVCIRYKADGLCSVRWPFCQKTCEACSVDLGENESESEIELATDDQPEEIEADRRVELDQTEDSKHMEEEQVNANHDEDSSEEIQVQISDGQEEEGGENQQDQPQACSDVLSSTICGNYFSTNQCEVQWRYCRRTCNACEGSQHPYEEPQINPEEPNTNINMRNRCQECERVIYDRGCQNLDFVVIEYCQNNCDMCRISGEIPLQGEGNDEGEETDNFGMPIDNEDILNEGPNPSDQQNGEGYLEVVPSNNEENEDNHEQQDEESEEQHQQEEQQEEQPEDEQWQEELQQEEQENQQIEEQQQEEEQQEGQWQGEQQQEGQWQGEQQQEGQWQEEQQQEGQWQEEQQRGEQENQQIEEQPQEEQHEEGQWQEEQQEEQWQEEQIQGEQQQDEQQPEVEQPEVEQPEVEQPEVEQPEVEQPEVEQPEVEQPEVEQPEVEQPEVEQPREENQQEGQPEPQVQEQQEPQQQGHAAGATEVNTPATAGDCRDVSTWCQEYLQLCNDPHHREDMRNIKCRKSCGMC